MLGHAHTQPTKTRMLDSGFDEVPEPEEELQAVRHLQSQGFTFSGRSIQAPKVDRLTDETLDHLHTLLTEANYRICRNRNPTT